MTRFNWPKLLCWLAAASLSMVPLILALALCGCSAAPHVTLSSGAPMLPPTCAAYHDFGLDCPDAQHGPCTHWALLNYRALQAEGRKPIYATWKLPDGENHMNVLYQARGVWMARDFGTHAQDVPVSDLISMHWQPWSWGHDAAHAWGKVMVSR